MKNKRRIYVAGLIALALIVGIYLWFFRGNRNTGGLYIVSGGQSYLEIKSGFSGAPRIEDGLLFHPDPRYHLKNRKLKSHFRAGRLILHQEDLYKLSIRVGPGDHGEYLISFRFECLPSKTIPGDWDLARGEIRTVIKTTKKPFTKEHRRKLRASDSAKEFFANLFQPFRDVNFLHFEYEDKTPLPSILHRVNDPALSEYYSLRIEGDSSEKALQLARKLAVNNTDDPFISLHLVEMEALRGNPEKAFALWDEWRSSYEKSAPPILLHIAKRTSQTIAMAKWKKERPDDINPFQAWDSKEASLQELMKCFRNSLRSDQLFTSDTNIASPLKIIFNDFNHFEPLSFNLLQIIRTLARLSYFKGGYGESLELFASLYGLGQSLTAFGGLQFSRNGFGLRDSISKDLLFHVLNACETKEDFHFCRDALDRLHRFDMDEDIKSIFDEELSPLVFFMKTGIRKHPYFDIQFSEPRQNLTRMNLQLVRAACAARYHFITTGNFPSSPEDFSPFLEDGIPRDFFTDKDAIRFFTSPQGEFVLYSVGPDGDDDKASVIYDFFKNIESDNGDIVIRIPREREFPFPREGVKAKNAYQLLELFPNGLPRDDFSNTNDIPFSILESTDEHPLVIFSFGPDRDEAEFKPIRESDLDKTEPVPTLAPKPGSATNRNLQKVMRRSETIPPPPGHWTLEPMYDPTNGANSNGDLFIEIPK